MKFIKLIQIACITFVLSGCSAMSGLSALDAVNPLKEEKGVNTDVQLGKNNQSTENKGLANVRSDTDVSTSNNIRAERVEQISSYKDAPWLILAFAIAAGFAIPNPFSYFTHRKQAKDQKEVINGLRSEIRGLYQELGSNLREARRAGREKGGQGEQTQDS